MANTSRARLGSSHCLVNHPAKLSSRCIGDVVSEHHLDVDVGFDEAVDVLDEFLLVALGVTRHGDDPDLPHAVGYLRDLGFRDVLDALERKCQYGGADGIAVLVENGIFILSSHRCNQWERAASGVRVG